MTTGRINQVGKGANMTTLYMVAVAVDSLSFQNLLVHLVCETKLTTLCLLYIVSLSLSFVRQEGTCLVQGGEARHCQYYYAS